MPREIRDETGAQRLIGYVIDLDPSTGQARCWLDVTAAHLNRHSVLHGGLATLLLDTASGLAGSFAEDAETVPPYLTVSQTTNFIAPGRIGRVTATAQIKGGGHMTKHITAELTHEDGTLIASSVGVYKRAPETRT